MLSKMMVAIGFALALAVVASGPQARSQTAKSASESFIKEAIEGNYAEINVGKLAEQKGTSEAVKRFGKMLVDDHTAANEKAIAAAQQLGVTPPTGSSIMEKGTYLKLKVLSGSAFDKSFANSMVSDHKADIREFEKEAVKNDPAGRFATEALPTLRKHLEVAQKLQQDTQTTGSK